MIVVKPVARSPPRRLAQYSAPGLQRRVAEAAMQVSRTSAMFGFSAYLKSTFAFIATIWYPPDQPYREAPTLGSDRQSPLALQTEPGHHS